LIKGFENWAIERIIRTPIKRREESLDHDIRILGERNWKNSSLSTEEWKKLLKKARAHAEVSNQ
jgi:hypothetical protein